MSVFLPEEREALFPEAKRFQATVADSHQRNQDQADLNKVFQEEILHYLPDDLLVKTDMASMAHGLELRSPFLDHEVMELTARMPISLKMQGVQQKVFLKRFAQQYLPTSILNRKKHGFQIPIHDWIRGSWQKPIAEALLAGPLIAHGFQKSFMEKLLQDHQTWKRNAGHQIFLLLTLSHWLRLQGLL
jgi:asparagine synthase (glutamine-hydrolysing)